ncbi:chromatin modification-related protein EAF1 B isoform X1 [Arachis hypogaea]|uniref:chromatin modification-related protein EAF1 B isoform X1 n=1 Tax=Arachis hypogaea TaxID=3818 RepID=UPI000DEC54E1|nr:chromatin modification-related protein EAF1 B isoform X2 [Arachis hypogaea]QHO07451.1 Chromatin modification-related protein A [Arachis hypogaea]
MHGCNSGSALLVNAEVDSMGGVVDGGVGIGLKTSPRRAAIEKAQAELRQEYDVREERRRELEFLEKGGNPLDFKFGNAASVSVQSTSFTDQHHEQLVTSEAKGSFALTASPHGDSVDSSARPGAPSLSEPNTADNLLLFDGVNELAKGEKRSLHSSKRNNIAPSEQSSQIGGTQIAKETEDSAIFRPYARRNRSRPNHGRGASRDGKGLLSDANKQKEHIVPSVSKTKPASSNGEITNNQTTNHPVDNELPGVRAHQTSGSASVPEDKLDITSYRRNLKDQSILPSQDDASQNPIIVPPGEANVVEEKDPPAASADLDPPPSVSTTPPGNESCSGQPNGFGNLKADKKGAPKEGQNANDALGMKYFDSESYTQTSLARDVNNDSDLCTNTKNVEANGSTIDHTSEFEMKLYSTGCEVLNERNMTNAGESGSTVADEHVDGFQNNSGQMVKSDNEILINNSCMQNMVNDSSNMEGVHDNDSTVSKSGKEESGVLVDHSCYVKESRSDRHQVIMDRSISETPQTASAETVTAAQPGYQPCSTYQLKLADKAREDSILEEARTIEVKRRRIAELSIHTLPTQNYQKSHWGFLLEEMAWLANDFAQERLWKMTAAAQLCHRASFTSRLRSEKQNKSLGMKILSHNIAKAVMQFWHSVECDADDNLIGGLVESGTVDSSEASRDNRRNSDTVLEASKYMEGQHHAKKAALKVRAYALNFLKDNRSHGRSSQAEAPTTPEKISDCGTVDMSWEDNLSEESLFYTVPPSAMESYRKSVESHFLQCEKTGSSIQEEVETSMYDTPADFGSEEITYDEDEAETSTYYLAAAYDGSRPPKSLQKRHKNRIKSYTNRSSEVGADLPYARYTTGTQPSTLFGKRPGSLHVGPIPIKRMRTASRQRVVSPFSGVSGTAQAQAKTDASSGDTSSFQDEQSTLHGSQIQKSVEVESAGEFEKPLPFDCAETSVKTKKKKLKNSGSTYDPAWQLDSVALNEQRDHSKKRLDSHHFESNGSSGLYGQHNVKKPKTMKQSLDNNFDNSAPVTNSIPSPAASQMSNMSNPSKFIRIISGRDRGRKSKALKVSAGQPGSGTPWSLFEDQALVVLVHDMGPNWELVSDAINSALQFKCIFRKPKECKERHKILMDRTAGDGADSAEDSGSSQSYPSTLPGIPKGSARQLFQRLREPMEEDTLKSHFDKIIKIGQRNDYRRNQNDNQDIKQLAPVHNSHMIALSQVCPNNLNGGVLTPLDLCDSNATSPELLSIGYQGSHAGGLPLPNHGSVPSALTTSGLNSPITPSSGMGLGNNLSSLSGPLTASVRDSRYGVPRTSPLSAEEQQRIQQYNQMMSGRNMQQSSMSVPGTHSGSDRGVRMLAGGNGMGMMGGVNRSIAMPRQGFQGMGSSSMLSSGGMISSSMVGLPSPVNVHTGVGAGPGNSMLRPREALHMMRPGHNQEHQRQMMVPELPMQVSQGNSQGVPAFSGMSSAFNNQTNPPPVQAYPAHAQQQHQLSQQQTHLSNSHPHLQGPNHATNSQQQAYAFRLAKERQLQQQQRYLQQQQQQFGSSNSLIPHVQSQTQTPISSSPMQNSPQAQPQNSSQQVSLCPVTPSPPLTPISSQHQQQKHHLAQHGFSRNPGAGGLTNQTGKQRQRQPQQRQYQQPSRQHPSQPQHVQSQQQGKVPKGIGRGNMVAHQNRSVDPTHLNGLSVPPGSQTVEKGDQVMQMMQGQNHYSGSGLNSNPPSKPLGTAPSNHSQLQQKLQQSGPANTSSKQLQPILSTSDSSIQGQVSPTPSSHITSPTQPSVIASNHHQLKLQSQPESKQINQNQSNVQKMLQQNNQVHSESSNISQSDSPRVNRQPANGASQFNTNTAMSQGCMDSAGELTAVPTASQCKTSEPPFDSGISNLVTQVNSFGGTPVGGNSAGSEPPNISQGVVSRSLSTSLPSQPHNAVVQWQQQPLPSQQKSSTQSVLSKQPYQPAEIHQHPQQQQDKERHSPKDVALQHQPQQQVQHLQPGQSSLLIRSPNSEVE